MALTKEIQDKIRAAIPCVEFDEINLRLEERITVVDFCTAVKESRPNNLACYITATP